MIAPSKIPQSSINYKKDAQVWDIVMKIERATLDETREFSDEMTTKLGTVNRPIAVLPKSLLTPLSVRVTPSTTPASKSHSERHKEHYKAVAKRGLVYKHPPTTPQGPLSPLSSSSKPFPPMWQPKRSLREDFEEPEGEKDSSANTKERSSPKGILRNSKKRRLI